MSGYGYRNGWQIPEAKSCAGEVWVQHNDPSAQYGQRFVARFKYARPTINARAFIKFLVANFTPAEYFGRMAAGEHPMPILESKGFVSPNVRRARRLAAESAHRAAA